MAKIPMGPPPPRKHDAPIPDLASSADPAPADAESSKVLMGPPPPRNPNTASGSTSVPNSDNSCSTPDYAEEQRSEQSDDHVDHSDREVKEFPSPNHDDNSISTVPKSKVLTAPYSVPSWSEHPGHPFYIEVLKDGIITEQLDVSVKGAYMFGRVDSCDFVLEHPTISRYHAVLQFKKSGEAFLYDLGSTHGTSINKSQVKKKLYTDVHVGDVIRFGQSSRLYLFQGPLELMPPEGDLDKLRRSKIQNEIKDREASLLRAKVEASLVDGISWGMAEDAPEEAIQDDVDEVTWQTYKGQLTERQEKTRGKIIKRMEKVANMRKEIDAIRAKDIAQGGLTQGQQTQIARNEQRMAQIMEELDSLEETLNESIQESIGARIKNVSLSRKMGIAEDEDDALSDDDDFYDRTKKMTTLKKSTDNQVETADTLLDKKEAIMNEMEERKNLLQTEMSKAMSETIESGGEGDALDAYMTGLSSEMALDATAKIEKEMSALKSDLDRILYLLKIADPAGEAARKRETKSHISTSNGSNNLITNIPVKPPSKKKKSSIPEKPTVVPVSSQSIETKRSLEEEKADHGKTDSEKPAYTVSKPQWLGAVNDMPSVEKHVGESIVDIQETDQFIDYKDRKKALVPSAADHEIEHAAPGLILRKRKHIGEPGMTTTSAEELTSTTCEVETSASDAVALLLKHKRGYFAGDDELGNTIGQHQNDGQTQKKSQLKRVLGPEKPAFLENNRDYESWMPPKGQSGDGRTSLNDKFGY